MPVQNGGDYIIYDGKEKVEIETSLVANSFTMDDSAAPYTLYFQASDLHPMGMKFYSIKAAASSEKKVIKKAAPVAATTATFRRSLRGKEENLKVKPSEERS